MTVILVPSNMVDRQRLDRRIRVVLEWVDCRNDQRWPLTALICQTPLPLQIRDLVRQMSSRLLTEALLKSPSSAELFHRSWQHRQREVAPLIGCIATSIRSLLSNATESTELWSLLQRLGLEQSFPNVITIGNVLTRIDLAACPPATRPVIAPNSAALSRRKKDPAVNLEDIIMESEEDEDDDITWPDLGSAAMNRREASARTDGSGDTALGLFHLSEEDEDVEVLCPSFLGNSIGTSADDFIITQGCSDLAHSVMERASDSGSADSQRQEPSDSCSGTLRSQYLASRAMLQSSVSHWP